MIIRRDVRTFRSNVKRSSFESIREKISGYNFSFIVCIEYIIMLRNIEKFANSFNMFIKPIRDFNRTIIFVSNLRIQFQFKYNLIIKKNGS